MSARLAGVFAVLALLLFASGSARAQTCSFDAETATVTVSVNSTIAEVRASGTSGKIRLNGVDCGAATVNNTDTVSINGTTSVSPELVTLKGQFAPGLTPEADAASEIEIVFALGGTCPACGGRDTATIELTAGSDRPVFTGGGIDVGEDGDQDITLAGTERVEVLALGGSDFVDARAYLGGGVVALRGGAGNDRLHGTAGADELYGEAGNDLLYGLAGNDELTGGLGDDTMYGGDGFDTFFAESTIDGADYVSGGAGGDEVSYRGRTGALNVTLGNGAADDGEAGEGDFIELNVENLRGGDGDDVLVGSSRENVIEGEGGGDEIHGGAGDDSLVGGGGADSMFGDEGDDDLDGEGGPDVLTGGPGQDLLFGYFGNDTIFNLDGEADDIQCGAGTDDAEEDPFDTFTDCEL